MGGSAYQHTGASTSKLDHEQFFKVLRSVLTWQSPVMVKIHEKPGDTTLYNILQRLPLVGTTPSLLIFSSVPLCSLKLFKL